MCGIIHNSEHFNVFFSKSYARSLNPQTPQQCTLGTLLIHPRCSEIRTCSTDLLCPCSARERVKIYIYQEIAWHYFHLLSAVFQVASFYTYCCQWMAELRARLVLQMRKKKWQWSKWGCKRLNEYHSLKKNVTSAEQKKMTASIQSRSFAAKICQERAAIACLRHRSYRVSL